MTTTETPPDVTTTCRCGEVVHATSAETLPAMLAGHWMFDESHAAFVAAEAVAR